MKKLLLMTAALGLFSGVYAKKVKFQVDMTGKTISPNGVHVAGNFQSEAGASGDWVPSETPMSNGGSGNIYSVIVDIPAHAYYEFKFINDNNWGAGEEAIPTLNQVGSAANGGSNNNRWWYIDSTSNDTSVLPAIMFGAEAPAGQFAIRFAVDMQKEVAVSADGIHVAGAFQGWAPGATSMTNLFTNNKVYEYIAYVDAGTYEFKYVNGNDWNAPSSPENIPSGCASGGNRSVVVTANAALDKVCFGSCTACPTAPIPTYNITFNVDMSSSDCDGGFDSVTVAGAGAALTNYGTGITMTAVGATQVYTVSLAIDSGEVAYKFRFHKNNNTNWEGGDNRIVHISGDSVLDLYCFNSRTIGACPVKPAPSSITFKLDLTNETPDAQGRIYVEGTFQTPNWKPGAVRLLPVSGQPGIYSITVDNICPGTFNYKFMNGDSSMDASEENFPDVNDRACLEPSGVGGFNRVYTRTSTDPVTLFYIFNSCTEGTTVGLNELNTLANNIKLYPNPTKDFTVIEFNDKASSHDVTIMDVTGKVLRTYTAQKYNTLRVDKENLTEGIYFLSVRNSNSEAKVVKLIITQ